MMFIFDNNSYFCIVISTFRAFCLWIYFDVSLKFANFAIINWDSLQK